MLLTFALEAGGSPPASATQRREALSTVLPASCWGTVPPNEVRPGVVQ